MKPQIYPRLLILKEKHNNVYFNIINEDTLYNVSLNILKARFSAGYYYKPEKPIKPEFTQSDIEKLPKDLQPTANKEYSQYTTNLIYYDRQYTNYQYLLHTIESNNGKLAWKLLREYSDGEYEGVELVQYTDPNEYG